MDGSNQFVEADPGREVETSYVQRRRTAAAPLTRKKLPESFFCKFLNRELKTVSCVEGYVNANSLNVRHSPCCKCPVGLKTRLAFARS